MGARGQRATLLTAAAGLAGLTLATLATGAFLLIGPVSRSEGCAAPPEQPAVLGPPGTGQTVGATEYGGPGDPSSGTVGSSGVNLLAEPDSYAELGGYTFATADALGNLPYGTPLRITWARHSVIGYKRDIGLGGGLIDGRYPRVIDLWWELAARLGIPYEQGDWSGPVRVARTPVTGAGATLSQTPQTGLPGSPGTCISRLAAGVPVVPGGRARLLSDGLAGAPADAPPAVRQIIAAGNQIVGKPYVYGGGHGLPLSVVAPSYDCSSSVDHLLYGARLLPVASTPTSGELESFGQIGIGRWVTLYASPAHVFLYVAGLRWDTWNAAGPGDGSSGIGWHPLVRNADGFVSRHPAGL